MSHGPAQHEVDVVVVGAGSAGATLAARLSEGGVRSVLLVERGARADPAVDELLRDPDRVPAVGGPHVTAVPLLPGDGGRSTPLLAGDVVGGSSSVNGAYFVRPTDDDLDRWARGGNDHWAPDRVRATLRRLEADAELGAQVLHGDSGPVPVTRHAHPLHPVTAAFFAAASALGHPEHPDLNDGAVEGWGLVPRNVDARGRVSAARAYLDPARGREHLTVRTGCAVRRVVVEDGRAVGVELTAGDGGTRVVRAHTVVVSAGALGSAVLLRRSGIGPAGALRAMGVEVVADAPGLGSRAANHPAVDLPFQPVGASTGPADGPLVQGALHLRTATGAVVEILATCRSYGRASAEAPGDETLALRVSVMSVPNEVQLWSTGAPDVVRARYLATSPARRALRDAVRAAAALAATAGFAALVRTWLGPDPATLSDDAALDVWIAERLGTSMHLCATAPMGPVSDPSAVVDQLGRVHGVEGLRVVDLSILPSAPTRGPACTAIAVAEHLAPTFA